MNISTLQDVKDNKIISTANELYRDYQADLIFPGARLKKRFLRDPKFLDYYERLAIHESAYHDCLVMADDSMTHGIAFIQANGFETEIFGMKMGHLHIKLRETTTFSGDTIQKLVDAAGALATKRIYHHVTVRIAVDSVALSGALQNCGYSYIASLLTFVYVRNRTPVKRLKSLYNVRNATEDDVERMLEISENAFSGTRFTNDPSLDRAKCALLYREWVKRCFRSGWASKQHLCSSEFSR